MRHHRASAWHIPPALPILGLGLALTVPAWGTPPWGRVEECRRVQDHLVCTSVTQDDGKPIQAIRPQSGKILRGTVTAVRDAFTLEVTLASGTSVLVYVPRKELWPITAEHMQAAALQHNVTVGVRDRRTDGVLIADVLLEDGTHLNNAISTITSKTPAAQQYLQEQETAKREHAQKERARLQAILEATQVAAQAKAAQEKAREEAAAQALNDAVSLVGRQALPTNYQERIDSKVAAMLKDPDSRKIEYLGRPYGSAVCGTINARNSFGGYVGRQPFLAVFDAEGRLQALNMYDDKEFSLLQYGLQHNLEHRLLQKCGVLHYMRPPFPRL